MIVFTKVCLDQAYTHTHLGALVMNHHQVVDDVQSKLPRGVQLQDVSLLTGSLPEHTRQTVIMIT